MWFWHTLNLLLFETRLFLDRILTHDSFPLVWVICMTRLFFCYYMWFRHLINLLLHCSYVWLIPHMSHFLMVYFYIWHRIHSVIFFSHATHLFSHVIIQPFFMFDSYIEFIHLFQTFFSSHIYMKNKLACEMDAFFSPSMTIVSWTLL